MRQLAVYCFLALMIVAEASATATPQKESIAWERKQRTYYTFAAEKLSGPAPLLLLLHGSGRDGM
jgi:poly(3-hydroxybutyrate) depolymerase